MSEPKMDLDEFLSLLSQSGLVSAESVDRLTQVYLKKSATHSENVINLKAIECELIGLGILTKWQIEKLKLGKFRGFFYGEYEIRDYLGECGDVMAYLCREVAGERNEVVVEMVSRSKASDPGGSMNWTIKYKRPQQWVL